MGTFGLSGLGGTIDYHRMHLDHAEQGLHDAERALSGSMSREDRVRTLAWAIYCVGLIAAHKYAIMRETGEGDQRQIGQMTHGKREQLIDQLVAASGR